MHEGAPGNGLEGEVLEAGENPPVALLPPQCAAAEAQGTWPYIAPADLFRKKIVLFCKVNFHQMLMKIHNK